MSEINKVREGLRKEDAQHIRGSSILPSLIPRLRKMSSLVHTVCALMHMRSITQNMGNTVNYCSFSWPENEASLDARLLTNVNIEGG